MRLTKSTIAIAAVIATLSFTSASMAYDTVAKATGDWNDINTWNPRIPIAGDDVGIAPGFTVGVSTTTAEVNSITIEDATAGNTPGQLEMKSGGTLQVDSFILVETAQAVDGVFDAPDSSGTAPVVKSFGAATLDGPFACSGALGITYAGDAGSDSFYLQSGTMTSQGGKTSISADFRNDGVVKADGTTSGYDIELTSACVISNSSVGDWEVTASNAKLIFNHDDSTAPSLSGDSDFLVSGGGEMDFNSTMTTAGGFKMTDTGSTCTVAAAKSFNATGAF